MSPRPVSSKQSRHVASELLGSKITMRCCSCGDETTAVFPMPYVVPDGGDAGRVEWLRAFAAERLMAALRSLTPDDRVETEHELAQATAARDGLRLRIAQLEAAGGQDIHLGKLQYQLDAQLRWIARYEQALA